jgi:ParB family transcriptional regulator, chromosome partitioning protein
MAAQERSSPSRPRLGRGLSSLISSLAGPESLQSQYAADQPAQGAAQGAGAKAPIAVSAEGEMQTARDLPLDQIAPNPYQPRREFPQEELAGLAASIAVHGVLQPIRVAVASDPAASTPYSLVAGERRLRAAKMAGLKTIPCVISRATPEQMLQWAVIENVHRSDLNPIERADAYQQFINRFNISQADLAESLGEPRTTIANYLRILDLQEEVRSMIAAGALSFGHAKVLAGLAGMPAQPGPAGATGQPGEADVQLALARRVLAESLSVRDLEALVAEAGRAWADGAKAPAGAAPARPRPAYIKDLEERLCASVGTRVRIQPGRRKNAGRLIIEYYSLDDFDRIAAILGVSPE